MPESDKGSRAKLVPPQRLVISDYMPELLKSLWTAQEYWWELPFDGLVEWLDSSDGGGKVPEVNGLPGLLTALREMPEGERMDELQNLVLYWWDLSEKKTTALPSLPPPVLRIRESRCSRFLPPRRSFTRMFSQSRRLTTRMR